MGVCLRVKNWDEHQHYKHRDPPWIKFYSRLLDNHDFTELPDQTKWLACGLLLLASRTRNVIKNDPEWIRIRTGTQSKPDLAALISIGFLEVFENNEDNHASTMLAYDASTMLEPVEKRREEKNGPIARGKPSLRTPPPDSPEWVVGVFGVLQELTLLNHPSLYDWPWWAKVHMAYPLDNGKIDIVLELKKMEAYYASNPQKQAKKNWKTLTYKWIGRAFVGAPWMKEGYSEKKRFLEVLRTHD